MQPTMGGDTSRGPVNGNRTNTDPPSERAGEYTGRHLRDNSPSKSLYDAQDDSKLPRDASWSHRDAPSDDKRSRFDDHSYHPSRTSSDNRGNSNDARPLSGDRAYSDRDRDREHDRNRDWERDRDRSRDRRPEFFPRSYGRSHAPRPPPELRHYEPDYSSEYVPRRYEPRDVDPDRRGGYRNSYDGRRQPSDDRRPPPIDDRSSRISPPSPDDRNPGPFLDHRPTKPPLAEDHSARPAADAAATVPRTGADERPPRPTTLGDDRAPRVPSAADPRPRPPVSLEERISQPAPSLQDRLSQPVPARVEVSRQPSLEERLSLAPVPTTVAATVTTPSSNTDRTLPDDRSARSGTVDVPPPAALNDRAADTRPPLDDRFSVPVSSSLPRQGAYPPPPRAASVVRDDPHVPPPPSKDNIPPVDRSDVRDFRSRDPSHERAPPPYRSDLDRGFNDDRNRTAMDVDPPARFSDTRGGPPPRRFSPPPPGDRRRNFYLPRSPPPPSRDALHPSERRYTSTDRDAFDRRRDWYGAPSAGAAGGAEDDKRQAWRYERPPLDRDNKDRFDHGRNVWDERDRDRDRERERDRDRARERERDRRFPSPPPRSLGSRLTDPFPPTALGTDDRLYPPPASARDFDRPRYAPGNTSPPFSRVRARSPSPPRRSGVDDLRPPIKRMRDEAAPPYASSGGTGTGTTYTRNNTYSPDRRASLTGEYGTRSAVGTSPPSSAGVTNNNFYDTRGPPPFSGGGDREYGSGGGAYGSVFDQSRRRSPPPPSRMLPSYRPTYPRGDPRDDRRYMPPPPPRAA